MSRLGKSERTLLEIEGTLIIAKDKRYDSLTSEKMFRDELIKELLTIINKYYE
jgi:septum formation topological specificity factor MinE